MSSQQKLDRAATVSGPIRVTLPVSVAYDLDKFLRALANVERMVGCPDSTSGIDVSPPHMREFVVDPTSLQVREAVADQ